MRRKDRWRRTVESLISTVEPCTNTAAGEKERDTNHMNGSLHVGLAALGAAIAVGLIGMKASDAVGRNPVASTKILVQSILSIAFAEAIVFYALFLVK